MLLFLLALLALVARAANIPAVPQNEQHIDRFIADHGKPLLEDFARASIASKTQRPLDSVQREQIERTAHPMFQRLAQRSPTEKVRYLTGMQKKVEILRAGWK